MGTRDTSDVILIILYVTGAMMLMIASYVIYVRKFRRGTLEAINNVVFTTSRYDKYHSKTTFMIDLPKASDVKLVLLDKDENSLNELLHQQLEVGLHKVEFNPADYENGIYYLSLVTDNASVLRRITIEKNS